MYASTSILLAISLMFFLAYRNIYDDINTKLIEQLHANTEISLNQQLSRRGMSLGNVLSENLFDALYTFNLELALKLLKPVLTLEEVRSLSITDAEGIIFHDGSEELTNFGKQHPQLPLIQESIAEREVLSKQVDQRVQFVFPIQAGNSVEGALFMELSMDQLKKDLDAEHEAIHEIREKERRDFFVLQALLTAIGMAIGASLIWYLAHTLTKPLNLLINHFRSASNNDYQNFPNDSRNDEIGELSRAYNEMSQKINKRTEAIKYMAYHDALTGLPNRTKFADFINSHLANEHTHSLQVFFIDIDGFKAVNDTYGHAQGDLFLIKIAERLSNLFTNYHQFKDEKGNNFPHIVSRVGGDEFLVCIVNAPKEHHQAMSNPMLEKLQKPVQLTNDSVNAGGSIGIVHYPEFKGDALSFIQYADMAMYEAKAKGKNTAVTFSEEMRKEVAHRMAIEKELQSALHDTEQFELWYQPKMDLTNSQIVGAEALVRWNHPQRGIIFPDEFIPISEASNAILVIGEALIERLFQDLSCWIKSGLVDNQFTLALNLSARQIYRQDLCAIFQTQLKKYQISPSQIQLEVTESLLLDDADKANEVLVELQKLGFSIWLDDFGTGYSSLTYLQNFNFDGVKIDRSFVYDIDTNNKSRELVKATLALAKSLNIDIIAEGIETQKHLKILADLGCKTGQGYYFNKPITSQELSLNYFNKRTSSTPQLEKPVKEVLG
ncbi:EAL domain-containing protein [Vibrio makurazakiensis]|uniref:putative bifunctional diguanylate cyclase/phosphodiesterase n=1 Tax=Vibrio makurazakiensis TaxID=2910250 RepID=UPI003D129D0A